jgi:hypothetical protein
MSQLQSDAWSVVSAVRVPWPRALRAATVASMSSPSTPFVSECPSLASMRRRKGIANRRLIPSRAVP